jgi:uncharacterized protein YjbI with pentapeptide repeats
MKQETAQPPQEEPQHKTRWRRLWEWTNFGEKGLWDWLQLLIVPAVLAVGGLLFSQAQDERQRVAEEQRSQAAALQAYIDEMGSLLLEEDLRSSNDDDEVRVLARARTLTVLNRLAQGNDPQAKSGEVSAEERGMLEEQLDPEQRERVIAKETDLRRDVLQFLKETGLINKQDPLISLYDANLRGVFLENGSTITLSNTDLRGANFTAAEMSSVELDNADLTEARLGGARLIFASLRDANLSSSDLPGADLSLAHLNGADLSFANLIGADLGGADLSGANLSGANLREADLSAGVNFDGADLSGADLEDADLDYANFSQATVTDEQISEAKTSKSVKGSDE